VPLTEDIYVKNADNVTGSSDKDDNERTSITSNIHSQRKHAAGTFELKSSGSGGIRHHIDGPGRQRHPGGRTETPRGGTVIRAGEKLRGGNVGRMDRWRTVTTRAQSLARPRPQETLIHLMNINEAQRGAERLIYQKHDAI